MLLFNAMGISELQCHQANINARPHGVDQNWLHTRFIQRNRKIFLPRRWGGIQYQIYRRLVHLHDLRLECSSIPPVKLSASNASKVLVHYLHV